MATGPAHKHHPCRQREVHNRADDEEPPGEHLNRYRCRVPRHREKCSLFSHNSIQYVVEIIRWKEHFLTEGFLCGCYFLALDATISIVAPPTTETNNNFYLSRNGLAPITYSRISLPQTTGTFDDTGELESWFSSPSGTLGPVPN
jgi:hypothetical protein